MSDKEMILFLMMGLSFNTISAYLFLLGESKVGDFCLLWVHGFIYSDIRLTGYNNIS